MSWYIVKRNWPQIDEFMRRFSPVIQYLGLGGDCWPLEESQDVELSKIHSSAMSHMAIMSLRDDIYGKVIIDEQIALRYFDAVPTGHGRVVLMEISSLREKYGECSGYDVGSGQGGYSIVESEVIRLNDISVIGRYVNENGLFRSIEAVEQYLSVRGKEREEVHPKDIYAIKVRSVK